MAIHSMFASLTANILGVQDWVIVGLVVVVVFFGGKKLPELAKGFGQGLKEFKKAVHDNTEEETTAAAPKPPSPPSGNGSS